MIPESQPNSAQLSAGETSLLVMIEPAAKRSERQLLATEHKSSLPSGVHSSPALAGSNTVQCRGWGRVRGLDIGPAERRQ
jgi:hypothetical protein